MDVEEALAKIMLERMAATDAVKALKRCKKIADEGDEDQAHKLADHVLCDFIRKIGHSGVAEAFYAVDKWYA